MSWSNSGKGDRFTCMCVTVCVFIANTWFATAGSGVVRLQQCSLRRWRLERDSNVVAEHQAQWSAQSGTFWHRLQIRLSSNRYLAMTTDLTLSHESYTCARWQGKTGDHIPQLRHCLLHTDSIDYLLLVYLWSPYVIGRPHIFSCCFFLSSFFFFFPRLKFSGPRLDVYHTLAHGMALVRI